jgi:hypothetical protein
MRVIREGRAAKRYQQCGKIECACFWKGQAQRPNVATAAFSIGAEFNGARGIATGGIAYWKEIVHRIL